MVFGMVSAALLLVSIVQVAVVASRMKKCEKLVGDRNMGGLLYLLCYGSGRNARRAAAQLLFPGLGPKEIRLLVPHLPLIEEKTAKHTKGSRANPKNEPIAVAVQTIRFYRNIGHRQCPCDLYTASHEWRGQLKKYHGYDPHEMAAHGLVEILNEKQGDGNSVYCTVKCSFCAHVFLVEGGSRRAPEWEWVQTGDIEEVSRTSIDRSVKRREFEKRPAAAGNPEQWAHGQKRRRALYMTAIAALAALCVFLFLSAAADVDSDLEKFEYSMRQEWRDGYAVSVVREEGVAVVDYYRGIERRWDGDKDNAVSIPLSDSQYEELRGIIKGQKLVLWNGWGKNSDPADSEYYAGFSLNIEWGDGKVVSAENNASFPRYPPNFKKADEAIYNFFVDVVGALSRKALFEEDVVRVSWLVLRDERDGIGKSYELSDREGQLVLSFLDNEGNSSETLISGDAAGELLSIFKKHSMMDWDGMRVTEWTSFDSFTIYGSMDTDRDEDWLMFSITVLDEGPEGFPAFREELLGYLDNLL